MRLTLLAGGLRVGAVVVVVGECDACSGRDGFGRDVVAESCVRLPVLDPVVQCRSDREYVRLS